MVVVNTRIPGHRAAALQTVRTARALGSDGSRVTILSPFRWPDARVHRERAIDPSPSRVVRVPCADGIDWFPQGIRALPARLQETTFGLLSGLVAAWCRGHTILCREIEAGALLAWTAHPDWIMEVHRIPRGRLRRMLLRAACGGAHAVVAISEGLVADLGAMGIGDVTVVPDAFDADGFDALPDRAAARRSVGPEDGRPLVVYAGHLFDWKGADVLAEASAILGQQAHVRILGGLAEDVERLRSQARLQGWPCEIAGHVDPRSIPMHLRAADIAVLPNMPGPRISTHHTSPLKAFEYVAAGVPVVASDLPALREVLGEDGALFVTPGHAGALAHGIQAALADRSAAAVRAEAAAKRCCGKTYDARARALAACARGRFAA